MQVFTMCKNTYAVLLTRWAQHTQTHTQMKRKPKVLHSTLQPMSETSWGSEFGLYLVVGGKGVFRDAAPDKGRWSDPPSHVGDSRLVPEFGWRIIGVHGGGVRVALSFLVEGQQRHVRRLDGPLLNPRDSKNPFVQQRRPPVTTLRNRPS